MPPLLYITNLPTPYRLPLYRRLAEMLRERGSVLHVFFLGYAKSERKWAIDADELRGFEHTLNAGPGDSTGSAAIRAVRTLKPAAVILAWAMDQAALRILLYCRLHGIPCVVVSGETIHTAAHNPHPWLRHLFRIPFFKFASDFITYGSASAAYLRSAGVPDARITTGVNAVDTAYFSAEVERLRESGAAGELQSKFLDAGGVAFRCHILFVGYLLPEKGLMAVLHALQARSQPESTSPDALHDIDLSHVALHIVGAGPEENALRDTAGRTGLGGRVFFHGYRQQSELPLYYAMADVLVFPSTLEVFGLVLVEAAAAGLPIIASNVAGGAADVVRPGVNGYLVEPDSTGLARHMEMLANDPALRARMGAESRRVAERFSIERSAECFMRAIEPFL